MVTQLAFADGMSNAVSSAPSAGEATGDGGAPQDEQIFGVGSMLNISSDAQEGPSTNLPFRARLWQLFKRMHKWVPRSVVRSAPALHRIIGVEYASNASDTRAMIAAQREVILAAGAIHTPQLLMLSGLGPSRALNKLGIRVRIDLPGIGANLQDHMQVGCWYPYRNPAYLYPNQLNTEQDLVDAAWAEYWSTKTGSFTSGAIDGVAFPSLPDTTSSYRSIVHLASSQSPDFFLPSGTDAHVAAGFAKQLPLLSRALSDRHRAAWEIINANDGDLAVANMRPFSRGTISLQSSDPFVPPLIDPRYGSNPIDILVLQAAIWFNARLLRTRSMTMLDPVFVAPAEDASIDEIASHIRERAQTEYHVSGTAAMMPQELGGVVDTSLLVYGTQNLRVVDASIFPMVPAAHLQAVVYGVAEKAADIVKANNQRQSASISNQLLPASSTTSSIPLSGVTLAPSAKVSLWLTTFVTTYTTWF